MEYVEKYVENGEDSPCSLAEVGAEYNGVVSSGGQSKVTNPLSETEQLIIDRTITGKIIPLRKQQVELLSPKVARTQMQPGVAAGSYTLYVHVPFTGPLEVTRSKRISTPLQPSMPKGLGMHNPICESILIAYCSATAVTFGGSKVEAITDTVL